LICRITGFFKHTSKDTWVGEITTTIPPSSRGERAQKYSNSVQLERWLGGFDLSANSHRNAHYLRIQAPGRRRALSACDTLSTSELLGWAYPDGRKPWQPRRLRRSAHRVAVPVGKRGNKETLWRGWLAGGGRQRGRSADCPTLWPTP